METNREPEGRAKGGLARAAKLSEEERREIARLGSAARWNVDAEVAVKSGRITIGDTVIACAVLSDKTRVLSERAITKAFGGKRGGSHWKRMKDNPDGANLPVFMSARNIIPFVSNDLMEALGRRRLYKPTNAGGAGSGIEATLLPKICNTLLRVRDAGADHPSQADIIHQADIIMRGLAEIGIVALVDEATGYIDDKDREEYNEMFRDFVRQHYREWEQEFPEQFTDMIYGLYGLPKGANGKHPQFFGHFIRKYIYTPLSGSNGSILAMLDEKNPRGPNGHRKFKMHQFLTDQIGLPAVRGHIWQVIGIGNASKDRDAFDRGCKRAFPQVGDQGDLLDLD